jgi:hypothetical protein
MAGCLNFMVKALVGVTVMMWIRWSLPRLRIDQVMTTCLKYCVPIAAVCFVGTVLWQYGFFVTDKPLPSLNDLMPATPRAAVREAWTATATSQPSTESTTDSPRKQRNQTTGRQNVQSPRGSQERVTAPALEAAMSPEPGNGDRLRKVTAS